MKNIFLQRPARSLKKFWGLGIGGWGVISGVGNGFLLGSVPCETVDEYFPCMGPTKICAFVL